jgi:succinylarginine dihydrolase
MNAYEVNFDGLIGPTHHYGGLSPGNLASQQNRLDVSHPRQAALQGLEKMKLLADLGLKQAILPPHPRPHLEFLARQGFSGTPRQIVEQAARERPDLLSVASSAAAMWTANAATISPGADAADGKVHITPANLHSTLHRQLEAPFTTRILRTIFGDERSFVVHDPLPDEDRLADEGAANHTRLCARHDQPGVELFVFGRDVDAPGVAPRRFPARQTRQASERISAVHGLSDEKTLFLQQLPQAIDAGVFHNDVIAVGNEYVLLLHEQAFVDQPAALDRLRAACDFDLHLLAVRAAELTLEEAVATYLFNSQLLSLPGGSPSSTSNGEMLLLCPLECQTHPRARAVIDRFLAGANPISQVRYADVRQSLRNGGGPACLRLRVVLTEEQLSRLRGNILLTDPLYRDLRAWIERHYRADLTIADLGDWDFIEECQAALEELFDLLV